MGYHHDTNYKLHDVKYYLKNKNYVETCKNFECKRTSLMRWVKKYKSNKTVKKLIIKIIVIYINKLLSSYEKKKHRW